MWTVLVPPLLYLTSGENTTPLQCCQFKKFGFIAKYNVGILVVLKVKTPY